MCGLMMKYFVLKPAGKSPYHNASRVAIEAYAEAIENENQCLAQDLREWALKEKAAALPESILSDPLEYGR